MTCNSAQPLIGAYLDGELDAARSEEIRQHIETCPLCTSEVTAIVALRDQFARLPRERVSDDFRTRMSQLIPAEKEEPVTQTNPAWWVAIAAAIVLAFLAGHYLEFGSRSNREILVAEVTEDHLRSLLPNHLLDVISTDRHTVKPWFDGKVTIAPTPWDLKTEGFPLLGGRLDILDNRSVPVLIYGRRKHIINVFVIPSEQSPESWNANTRGYNLVAWSQGGLEYVAISDLDPDGLKQFAELFQKQT